VELPDLPSRFNGLQGHTAIRVYYSKCVSVATTLIALRASLSIELLTTSGYVPLNIHYTDECSKLVMNINNIHILGGMNQ
jgi:hypothetical protein